MHSDIAFPKTPWFRLLHLFSVVIAGYLACEVFFAVFDGLDAAREKTCHPPYNYGLPCFIYDVITLAAIDILIIFVAIAWLCWHSWHIFGAICASTEIAITRLVIPQYVYLAISISSILLSFYYIWTVKENDSVVPFILIGSLLTFSLYKVRLHVGVKVMAFVIVIMLATNAHDEGDDFDDQFSDAPLFDVVTPAVYHPTGEVFWLEARTGAGVRYGIQQGIRSAREVVSAGVRGSFKAASSVIQRVITAIRTSLARLGLNGIRAPSVSAAEIARL